MAMYSSTRGLSRVREKKHAARIPSQTKCSPQLLQNALVPEDRKEGFFGDPTVRSEVSILAPPNHPSHPPSDQAKGCSHLQRKGGREKPT